MTHVFTAWDQCVYGCATLVVIRHLQFPFSAIVALQEEKSALNDLWRMSGVFCGQNSFAHGLSPDDRSADVDNMATAHKCFSRLCHRILADFPEVEPICAVFHTQGNKFRRTCYHEDKERQAPTPGISGISTQSNMTNTHRTEK